MCFAASVFSLSYMPCFLTIFENPPTIFRLLEPFSSNMSARKSPFSFPPEWVLIPWYSTPVEKNYDCILPLWVIKCIKFETDMNKSGPLMINMYLFFKTVQKEEKLVLVRRLSPFWININNAKCVKPVLGYYSGWTENRSLDQLDMIEFIEGENMVASIRVPWLFQNNGTWLKY